MQSGDAFLLSVLFPGQLRQLREFLGDVAVAAPAMGDQTAAAILDAIADIGEVAAALPAQHIQGAVAEQAVEICKSLVTGEIFTIFILKKTIGIFHLQHSHPSITCKVCALAQICV
mgnify:CR=1 FL=1